MKNNLRKIVLVLSVLFTAFVGSFALDVLGEEKWLLALSIHLIPTYVLIILTIISWKKEFVGGILWILLGIFFLKMSLHNMIVAIPSIIIGVVNIIIGKIGSKLV